MNRSREEQTHPDEGREGLHGLLLVVAVDLDDLEEGDLLHGLLAERSEDGAKGFDLGVLLLGRTPVVGRHERVEDERDDLDRRDRVFLLGGKEVGDGLHGEKDPESATKRSRVEEQH